VECGRREESGEKRISKDIKFSGENEKESKMKKF